MKLNNTSKYAIRILNFTANYSHDKLLSARDLSEKLNIPYKFLTKIITELVKEGYIEAIRGRDGGNKLLRDPAKITIMEVLNTFNDFRDQNECILGIDKCSQTQKCALHDQWLQPKTMIEEMFQNTTIKDLDGKNLKI